MISTGTIVILVILLVAVILMGSSTAMHYATRERSTTTMTTDDRKLVDAAIITGWVGIGLLALTILIMLLVLGTYSISVDKKNLMELQK